MGEEARYAVFHDHPEPNSTRYLMTFSVIQRVQAEGDTGLVPRGEAGLRTGGIGPD